MDLSTYRVKTLSDVNKNYIEDINRSISEMIDVHSLSSNAYLLQIISALSKAKLKKDIHVYNESIDMISGIYVISNLTYSGKSYLKTRINNISRNYTDMFTKSSILYGSLDTLRSIVCDLNLSSHVINFSKVLQIKAAEEPTEPIERNSYLPKRYTTDVSRVVSLAEKKDCIYIVCSTYQDVPVSEQIKQQHSKCNMQGLRFKLGRANCIKYPIKQYMNHEVMCVLFVDEKYHDVLERNYKKSIPIHYLDAEEYYHIGRHMYEEYNITDHSSIKLQYLNFFHNTVRLMFQTLNIPKNDFLSNMYFIKDTKPKGVELCSYITDKSLHSLLDTTVTFTDSVKSFMNEQIKSASTQEELDLILAKFKAMSLMSS